MRGKVITKKIHRSNTSCTGIGNQLCEKLDIKYSERVPRRPRCEQKQIVEIAGKSEGPVGKVLVIKKCWVKF